jgi:outer membrane protein insertion porin family
MKKILFLIFFTALSAQATPIDEIRFDGEGLTSDQILTLKGMNECLPGDEYESDRANQSLGKLMDFLRTKGYVEVKGSESFGRNRDSGTVLEYRFDLGQPLRLVALDVVSKDGSISEELRQRILQKVEVRPNELYDLDRIKDIKRAIEVVLLGQNFIDSKVVDVIPEKVDEHGRKAVFKIDLGQRVIFSVVGSRYFSRNELASVIDEQRQVGLGRDYVSVLMGTLTNHYLEYGFKSVKITPYTFESTGNEPRKVVFEIEEGPRLKIHKVIFDGQEIFDAEELTELFFAAATSRIRSRIYNEKMIESAAKGVIEELKKRGYLSAKLIAVKTVESTPENLDVRIFISEGVQTSVQAIDFSGNRIFQEDQLKDFMGIHEDQPLNLAQLESGLENIKRQYRNLGYLNVSITNENSGTLANYSERNQFAFLSVEIDEGEQLLFAGLRIYGMEKTKRVVIEREVFFKVEDPLSETILFETEDRLRKLGVFGQVTMELLASDRGSRYRELKITVSEAVPGNLGFGIGFRNDLGVRVFGEVTYANLWGLNHSWVFNVSGNRRVSNYRFTEFTAQAGYIWPWFAWGETTFRPNLSGERRQYRAFDAETYGFSASFDRLLIKSANLYGSLTYAIEQVSQFNAVDATQNQQIRIGSITPGLRLDLRDQPLTPRKGYFGTMSFEYANDFLGSQDVPFPVNYGRFQTRNDFYLNFIPRVVWFTSIRGGWLKNFARASEGGTNFSIPLIKQFALGGINSMRGYVEQEINVQATDSERRVQNFMTFVNYRTQLDFFATDQLSVGPFLDAGNLNVDRFELGGLQYGTGVGLRYMTPVGPVNFDWGFKLNAQNTTDRNVFYFSLGVN